MNPPSMSTFAPVMKRHSSEARNTPRAATSSGSPEARPGRARMGVREQLGILAALARHDDLAGRDRVADDALLGEVDGDLARQVDDAALHGRVRDVAGRADHAVLRGDVDHAAAHLAARLLGEHLAHGALAAQEEAAQADVEDDVPVVLAGLEQALRVGARDHRVVDDHVEPAVAELERGRDEPVDVGAAADVGLDEARDAAGVGDQLIGRRAADVQRVAADVADDDARALGGESEAERAPDPRGAAGDDDRAILESRHAADGRGPERVAAADTLRSGAGAADGQAWIPTGVGMSQLDEDDGLAGEERCTPALASIPGVSVVVFDRESRIRALHGTALQQHGYVHELMIGRRTDEVMPPEVWARLGPLFARALAGETVTIQQRSQDGAAVYESTFSPVRQDGHVVAGTMTSRDITAQVTAEAELAEANAQFADANAQFQAILDHSPMAIYLRDREQRWVVTNAETCGDHRQAAEELAGRTMAETVVARAAVERMAAHDREVMETGEAQSFDESVPDAPHRRDAPLLVAASSPSATPGEIVGVGGVSLDVTERERAARELAAARALFETAFDVRTRRHARQPRLQRRHGRGHRVQPRLRAHARPRPRRAPRPRRHVDRAPDDLPTRQRMLDDVLAGRPPRASSASSIATATTSAL